LVFLQKSKIAILLICQEKIESRRIYLQKFTKLILRHHAISRVQHPPGTAAFLSILQGTHKAA
jgi:hypothetical protein